MRLFFSERQTLHRNVQEIAYGRLTPANDRPERTAAIRDALLGSGLVALASGEAPPVPLDVLHAVHDPGMVDFLRGLHDRWNTAYPGTFPFPETTIAPGMRRRLPTSLRGQLAHYCFDTCAAVVQGTWEAVVASLAQAHAATLSMAGGERLAFALCRPPGHHAGRDFYGGYCYANTAAVAAETWVRATGASCAVLDIDFHHGNGTQHIFWERGDVEFVSVHASPAEAYPFFSGYTDETGSGAGLGHTRNFPLSMTTRWPEYAVSLAAALQHIERSRAQALIVSLGTDTFHGDPVGGLGLKVADFEAMGREIADLQLPTVVIMEGGYDLNSVGDCVASFVRGLRPGESRP